MTAVAGGAVIPLATGALADKVGIQHSLLFPILCYLSIGYYGLSGSKPTRTDTGIDQQGKVDPIVWSGIV
jgi:fucose permease